MTLAIILVIISLHFEPENPSEKIYEDWDCPLVEAVASIEAENSNELPLQKGDKANVLRKLSDSGMIISLSI